MGHLLEDDSGYVKYCATPILHLGVSDGDSLMGAGRVVSGPCCLHVPCQLIFSVIISSSTVISFLVFSDSTRQMMKKSPERMVTKSTMF